MRMVKSGEKTIQISHQREAISFEQFEAHSHGAAL